MSTRLLLALAAAAPTALAAQRVTSTASTAPHVGIMAGVNFSTFVGGLYLALPSGSPLIAFRPEVLVSHEGALQQSPYGTITDALLGYLEVPLLVQLAIPTGGPVRPRVYAGPSLAFRTSCRLAVRGYYPIQVAIVPGITTSFTTGCTDPNDDVDLGVKSFDLGGVVGGQMNVAFGGHALGVGARYTHGFNTVTQYGTVKNRTLSVYGSLELPYGR